MTTCAPSNQRSVSYVFGRLGRFSEQRVRCIFKFNVLAARPKAFPLQPHLSASLSDTTETGLLEALDPHPFRSLLPGLRWSLGQWQRHPEWRSLALRAVSRPALGFPLGPDCPSVRARVGPIPYSIMPSATDSAPVDAESQLTAAKYGLLLLLSPRPRSPQSVRCDVNMSMSRCDTGQ